MIGIGPTPKSGRRSFVWRNGQTAVLPTYDGANPPWGNVSAINDESQAIGVSYITRAGRTFQHAVLWTMRP